MTPNVCLLGPEIDHRLSLSVMLGQAGGNVIWVPNSQSCRSGDPRAAGNWRSRVRDVVLGTRDPVYLQEVVQKLDAARCTTVIGYWGTLPLADLIAIKRLRPSITTVLMLLCFPLSLNSLGIARQKLAVRLALPSLDGLVCPTREMAAYLGRSLLGYPCPPIVVVPPCWPAAFAPRERNEVISDRPNLIYVGRTDLSGATVHAADDLRPLMRSILDAGVELHHVRSPETDDGHPLRKPFMPRSNTELTAFMTGFDASLIAYNTAAAARQDRFDLTVPDRLISSVAAGIPVAIPRQGFAASKTYLESYGAVICYDTPEDLRRTLQDRAYVRDLKEVAWRARHLYSAERQGGLLVKFLSELGRPQQERPVMAAS